jgi:hypothetical protein
VAFSESRCPASAFAEERAHAALHCLDEVGREPRGHRDRLRLGELAQTRDDLARAPTADRAGERADDLQLGERLPSSRTMSSRCRSSDSLWSSIRTASA